MLVDPINADLPSCPPEIGHNKHVAFPSLVFIFLSLAFTSATYGIIVLLKFNSVKVFKRYALHSLWAPSLLVPHSKLPNL